MTNMNVLLSDGGNPPEIWTAQLKHEFHDGCHIFTSDGIPGFMVASRDAQKVLRQIIPTIKALIKLTHGVDCHVKLSRDFREFEKKHFHSNSTDGTLKDTTVVIEAVAA